MIDVFAGGCGLRGKDHDRISGEDINSPRQKFTIDRMREEQFSNLVENTWHLIRHERGEKE